MYVYICTYAPKIIICICGVPLCLYVYAIQPPVDSSPLLDALFTPEDQSSSVLPAIMHLSSHTASSIAIAPPPTVLKQTAVI